MTAETQDNSGINCLFNNFTQFDKSKNYLEGIYWSVSKKTIELSENVNFNGLKYVSNEDYLRQTEGIEEVKVEEEYEVVFSEADDIEQKVEVKEQVVNITLMNISSESSSDDEQSILIPMTTESKKNDFCTQADLLYTQMPHIKVDQAPSGNDDVLESDHNNEHEVLKVNPSEDDGKGTDAVSNETNKSQPLASGKIIQSLNLNPKLSPISCPPQTQFYSYEYETSDAISHINQSEISPKQDKTLCNTTEKLNSASLNEKLQENEEATPLPKSILKDASTRTSSFNKNNILTFDETPCSKSQETNSATKKSVRFNDILMSEKSEATEILNEDKNDDNIREVGKIIVLDDSYSQVVDKNKMVIEEDEDTDEEDFIVNNENINPEVYEEAFSNDSENYENLNPPSYDEQYSILDKFVRIRERDLKRKRLDSLNVNIIDHGSWNVTCLLLLCCYVEAK